VTFGDLAEDWRVMSRLILDEAASNLPTVIVRDAKGLDGMNFIRTSVSLLVWEINAGAPSNKLQVCKPGVPDLQRV
jgi:hypothetical protein